MKQPRRIGICWVDAETFWWDATNAPNCPVCPDVEDGQHGFFVPEARVQEAQEAEFEYRHHDPFSDAPQEKQP